MHAFQYVKPSTLAGVSSLLANGGQIIAGGQTLLPSMKLRLMSPESLVDLSSLQELSSITVGSDSVVLGAMVRHSAVETHAGVQETIPALSRLAGGIGDRQVRALGTVGGSVANNDPAACYPSACLALGATIHTTQRAILADDFFLGMYSTALEPAEWITSISFPVPKAAAYAKFKQPASRFALVGVFVAQTVSGVRVAITGAGQGVFRHSGIEEALSKKFAPEAIDGVVVDSSELNEDLHASALYRAHLIKVQTQVAVKEILGQNH
jgi:carbon-monoxide dehydrogenase medium subunit